MNVEELYNETAHRYSDLVERSKYIGPDWLSRFLEANRFTCSSIVDLGCANGVLGEVLRNSFANAYIAGIDISENMIRYAESKACYNKTIQMDLNKSFSQLFDQPNDLIVALGFSEFLINIQVFMDEVAAITKPGGIAVISFQIHDPNNKKLPRNTYSGEVVHTAYTESEINDFITNSGFEVFQQESAVGYTSGAGYSCEYLMVAARKA
ncbi:methyltransferase domain-containing protein [Reinekea forsetii]|nr:methyltransferase domain-containing protein [Reinekea forsetii]